MATIPPGKWPQFRRITEKILSELWPFLVRFWTQLRRKCCVGGIVIDGDMTDSHLKIHFIWWQFYFHSPSLFFRSNGKVRMQISKTNRLFLHTFGKWCPICRSENNFPTACVAAYPYNFVQHLPWRHFLLLETAFF